MQSDWTAKCRQCEAPLLTMPYNALASPYKTKCPLCGTVNTFYPDAKVILSLDGRGSDARLDTSNLPKPKLRTLFPRVRRWYFYSVLQALRAECRSLIGRIGFSTGIHAAWNRADTGLCPPVIQPFLVHGSDIERRTYIQDMRQLQAEYPFLTYSDRLIMARAWMVGAHRCSGISCSEQCPRGTSERGL